MHEAQRSDSVLGQAPAQDPKNHPTPSPEFPSPTGHQGNLGPLDTGRPTLGAAHPARRLSALAAAAQEASPEAEGAAMQGKLGVACGPLTPHRAAGLHLPRMGSCGFLTRCFQASELWAPSPQHPAPSTRPAPCLLIPWAEQVLRLSAPPHSSHRCLAPAVDRRGPMETPPFRALRPPPRAA